MKYFNKYRIRFFVAAFFQLLLFAAIYLPAVRVVSIQEFTMQVEVVSKSAQWFLSNAGYPEIYNTIVLLYILFSLPILILGFKEPMKRWPLLTAAITGIVFMALNLICTLFVFSLAKDVATLASLTAWFWVYLLVQALQIVHLFMMYIQIKKAQV